MNYLCKTGLGLVLLFALFSPSHAQKTIHGTVADAATGETLPSATLLIEGTYKGTITNSEGRYTLAIPDSLLPVRLTVRFLGYHSAARIVDRGSASVQDFALRPSVLEMEEIVVTGEDPAVGIMREVIRRKREWRARLETYRAEAYTRQTLSNDTAIVMITESVSDIFWHRKQGHREVIKSRRQTANIQADRNLAGVSYVPNFYDDDIEIAGFSLMGVTHPDALRYYDFKLEDYRTIDDRVVFEISVSPARTLQPLFRGTIYVLDGEYALLEVSLRPNEVVKFPPPVEEFDTYYEQQFSDFGREFWLPVDMRIAGKVKISMIGLDFPLIQFRQLARITDYRVNAALPDSLYESSRVLRTQKSAGDSLFVSRVEPVPLSEQEREAYATVDSTATLEKAFRPSGFLARFVDDEEENGRKNRNSLLNKLPGELSPMVRFNRVDEFFGGLKYSIRPLPALRFTANGGYNSGYGEWDYGGALEYALTPESRVRTRLGISLQTETATQYVSGIYDPALTLPLNLFGEDDYYDYYRREGLRAFARVFLPRRNLSLEAGFTSEKHRSLPVGTGYDVLGRDTVPLANPAVDEGRMQSVDAVWGYNLNESYNMGVTGLKRIKFEVEYSDASLGSDFDFVTYRTAVDWSFPTFYGRRLLPNTLEVKLAAGTYSGTPPLQRAGAVDGALTYFTPFGTLKSLRGRPYRGERYAVLAAEHNFRTVPFELLGLQKPVDWNWSLIAFAGAGRAWPSASMENRLEELPGYAFPRSERMHLEAGLSLNGLFGLFRVDGIYRIDEPGWFVGVSVARLF